jgi:tetratricopeptide (TPR) repeat protein
LPAAVVAVVAGSIVYAVRSSPRAGGDPPSDVATARAEEKPTIAPPAVSAGGAAATVDPAVSGTATSAAAQPAPAPAVEKTPAGAETSKRTEEARADERKLTLSELLTSASTARRGGDAVRARALLERALVVSPGNVEAHAGLGDLARASGDLANARTSYEKALATSPTYAPALLALADTEWELGDRAAAERHYRALVATASSPPERAKTRAGSAGAAGTTTTPAPAIKTLTEADFPPPAPAAPKPNED